MTYEQITVETQGPVKILTLNRPEKLNAWTYQMSAELTDAIEVANNDKKIGALVITGAGRGFCAGADIEDTFKSRIDSEEKSGGQSQGLRRDWVSLLRESKPIVAAVNGVAVGVGATMILPCDVLVASESAKIGMFFIKMGLVPELASSHYLVQRMGFGRANEMCLSGRMYSAQEAHADGLFDRLVPAEQLLDKAMEIAGTIAENPRPQLRMVKQLLSMNGCETDMSEAQRREMELLQQCYQSPEHKEAVQAFMEKRKPNFD